MTAATTGVAEAAAVSLLQQAMHTSEGVRDPYPLLTQLHEHGELVHMPEGYVAVWGYAACNTIMRSPSFGRRPPDPTLHAVWQHDLTPEQAEELRRAEAPELGLWLQLIDGDDHLRQRSLVTRAFTPRRLAVMRTQIERVVTELADRLPLGEPVDFMAEIAYPLPTQVVGELIGLPLPDREWVAETSATQTADRDPNATFEGLLVSARGRRDLAMYTRNLLAERRRDPREDLASDLIRAEAEGERLSEPELLALVIMMYLAGLSTTAHMLGNGLVALLRHPEQLEQVRADPALMPGAVEEILRYDTIVQTIDYNVHHDDEVAGVPLTENTPLHLFLGAANRDPQVFSAADRFDILRREAAPASFGAGAHFCLGAALARLEGEIALSHLVSRFDIELVDPDPARAESFTYRFFPTLPLVLSVR